MTETFKNIRNFIANPQRLKKSMFVRRFVLKRLLPLDFPYILNIEPTNACNLECMMCPRRSSKKPVGFMAFDLYKKIIDECARHKRMFRLFLQKDGEPLLHPEIAKMVEYAKRKNIARHVAIITNGSMLDEKCARDLINAGLDEIIVSIDTTSPEKYARIKGKNCLRRVEENIEAIIRLRSELRVVNPFIHARILNMNLADEELDAFKLRWRIADDIDVIPFHTWHGAVDEVSGNHNGSKPKRYPCSLLWYTGVVNWDGDFSLCCIDYNSDGVVGNVNDRSIHEIWNGAEMRRVRDLHLQGEYKDIPICAGCEYWRIKEDIGAWLRKKKIT